MVSTEFYGPLEAAATEHQQPCYKRAELEPRLICVRSVEGDGQLFPRI